jgi:hypothetical protein
VYGPQESLSYSIFSLSYLYEQHPNLYRERKIKKKKKKRQALKGSLASVDLERDH